MRRLLPLLLLLVLAGCGSSTPAPTSGGPAATTNATTTAASAKVYDARGQERATVILLHGWNDVQPTGYEPWIAHLNEQGVTVLYPHYQQGLLSTPAQMLQGAEQSIRAGLTAAPPSGPVIVAGYSLGGGFAVVYAANAKAWGVAVPAAVYAVFPALPPSVPEPFGTVADATSVTLLASDDDQVVGRLGADALAAAISPHPATIDLLASTEAVRFDHFAPKRTDDEAQRAFWRPLDQIVDRLAPR